MISLLSTTYRTHPCVLCFLCYQSAQRKKRHPKSRLDRRDMGMCRKIIYSCKCNNLVKRVGELFEIHCAGLFCFSTPCACIDFRDYRRAAAVILPGPISGRDIDSRGLRGHRMAWIGPRLSGGC